MIVRYLSLLLVLLSCASLRAQDEIRVMGYNLLFYGSCTGRTVPQKNAHLRTLIQYYRPELIGFNEVNGNPGGGAPLANNLVAALNEAGVKNYALAPYSNLSNTNLANLVVYDTSRFVYHSRVVTSTWVRDITAYKLYYKDPNLSVTQDTTFLTIIPAHLKAGSSASDLSDRATETTNLMTYITGTGLRENRILLGDLNVRSSAETSYQNLTGTGVNADYRFFDPVLAPGNWNNNASFSQYHTQSTRSTDIDCGVGGGMDDRFDFILLSQTLLNGEAGFTYKSNSYLTPGQDGNRCCNGSLLSPTNNSLPTNILQALYEMSDHLPVILDLEVDALISGVDPLAQKLPVEVLGNPFGELLRVRSRSDQPVYATLYNLQGQPVMEGWLDPQSITEWPTTRLATGFYLLSLEGAGHQPMTLRLTHTAQ